MLGRTTDVIISNDKIKWILFITMLAVSIIIAQAIAANVAISTGALTEQAAATGPEQFDPNAAYAQRYRQTLAPLVRSVAQERFDTNAAYAQRDLQTLAPLAPSVAQEQFDPYEAYAQRYLQTLAPLAPSVAQEQFDPYEAYAQQYLPVSEDQVVHK